jgi:hypothetical protein
VAQTVEMWPHPWLDYALHPCPGDAWIERWARQDFEELYLGKWEASTREDIAESLAKSAYRSGLVVVGYDPASEADLSAIVILVAPARQGAAYRERLAESLQARAEREYPGVTVIVRFA